MEGVHARAAQRPAQLWQLPTDVGLAIGAHHRVEIEGFPHPLAATVCIADELASAREALRLGDKQLALIERDAAQLDALAS